MEETTKEYLQKYAGEKIKFLRKQNKWTQKDLADKLGVGVSTVTNYESGYRATNQDVLFDLAQIFEVSINEFFPPIESKNTPETLNTYNLKNFLTEIEKATNNFTIEEKGRILDFIFTIKNSKVRNSLSNNVTSLDLAIELANSNIVSVTELANYAIRAIEDTGNVRKQVQDLLGDCKIFIDEEKTNTAEFINVKRKIYEILLPLRMFVAAFEKNVTTIEVFSKHFHLSREFLVEAIGYYATFKGTVFEYNHYIIDISNIPLEYSNIDDVNEAKIIITNTNQKTDTKKKRFFN